MTTSRPPILLVLALALAGLSCAPPRPPDLVLIVVDTLRADRLGLYGYQRDTSPNIDAWASEAAIFDRALATSPWTLPTIGSILTGELPRRHAAGLKKGRGRFRRAALDESLPTLAEILHQHGFETAAIVNNPFLRPRFGLSRGFEHYDHAHRRPAEAVVRLALARLAARDDRPLFLFLHFLDPHLPYRPPESARRRFSPADSPAMPPLRQIRDQREQLTDSEKQRIGDLYDEEIAYLDQALGRLFEALSTEPTDRQPLIVLTSDHGEELFDHGGFEHGHSMYQELLRVPLLIRGPGITPGRHSVPVSVADLTPTLLDAAGLDEPHDSHRGEHSGTSIWPLLEKGRDLPGRPLVAETTLYGPQLQTVVDWPLKLVLHPRSGQRSLYDLDADPGERIDLAERRPAEAERLESLLRARAAAPAATREVPLDAQTREELEALGYLD